MVGERVGHELQLLPQQVQAVELLPRRHRRRRRNSPVAGAAEAVAAAVERGGCDGERLKGPAQHGEAQVVREEPSVGGVVDCARARVYDHAQRPRDVVPAEFRVCVCVGRKGEGGAQLSWEQLTLREGGTMA